jgi:PAS domain S-box-containing protein
MTHQESSGKAQRQISEGAFILARMDAEGKITFANRALVETSGWSEGELNGQTLAALMHPDTPPEVAADMWSRIKAGKAWSGVYQHACKGGGAFWVASNVSALWENGQVAGYIALSRNPGGAEIEAAQKTHAQIKTGAGALSLRDSVLYRTGAVHQLHDRLSNISIKVRIWGMTALTGIAMLIVGGAGINGMMHSDAMIKDVYAKAMAPAELAMRIRFLLADNRSQIMLGMQHNPASPLAAVHTHPLNLHLDVMTKNSVEITHSWDSLSKVKFDPAMAATAKVTLAMESFQTARKQFGNEGILPAKSALQAGMYDDIGDMLADSINPLYEKLNRETDNLNQALASYAQESRTLAETEFRRVLGFSIAATVLAVLLAALTAWLALRAILQPIQRVTVQMREIRQGNLDSTITTLRQDEVGEMTEAFRTLYVRLGFDIADARRQARQAARTSFALKQVNASVTMTDEDGNLIFVNDAAEKLLSELCGKPVTSDALYGLPASTCVSDDGLQKAIADSRHGSTSADGLVSGIYLRINSTPVFDDKNRYTGSVTQWTDRSADVEAEQRAAEAFRMGFALENVEAAVMVADEQNRLLFANTSGNKLLQKLTGQNDALARFSGKPVDGIVEDETLRRLLGKPLAAPETAEGTAGSMLLRLYAAPIHNADGQLAGRLMQWQDRTLEAQTEREVAMLVAAVSSGNFSHRIDESNKQGFFHTMAQGLNQLSHQAERGLSDVAAVLNALARGDLTQRVDAQHEGMFGQLSDDANATVDYLRDVVTSITESTDTIHNAAREITVGNAELAQRTESQSASLEETAASTEQLNSTVKNNDDNAHQANDLARSASEVAARGGRVVAEVVETMGAISASSAKIADIINVIDGIAFQTNILALNAAVEAARAGEQGRGFAVVAGEVRNLAQRSAAAAKEIKELITESAAKVSAGHKLVETAGETMGEVVSSVERVSHIMNEITVSSAEQRNGIEQLNLSITSMDEATQQNVALVEEASAAAQSLEDQADSLKQAVSVFRLVGAEAAVGGGFTERRSANRATNVERITPARPARAARATAGGNDTWEEF